MTRLTVILALVLLSPALAGCFANESAPVEAASVATSAKDAGAVAGPAPSAARTPYQVQTASDGGAETAVTVYPLEITTNPRKEPYVQEFSGEFQPYSCMPTGGGVPLGALGMASSNQFFDVTEAFVKNDVFSFDVSLTFTNTDQSWGELHLWHQFDGVSDYWNEPTSDGRGEIVLNFTGQGFIVTDEFLAAVGVDCWYGSVTSPIAYTIELAVTFAEGAVPSQAPVLVSIPANATRLFVSGLALDPERPVTSHFRVFAPDDSLLCECALLSSKPVAEFPIAEAGDYIILVDHTEGGFVALGLDAPAVAPVRFLGTRFEQFDLAGGDGGAVDTVVDVVLPSTPLNMWMWVFAPGEFSDPPNAGAGHNVKLAIQNARGEVMRNSMVGYITFHAAVPGMFSTNDWYAIPIDGDWEFWQDHHAFDLGTHQVTVKADQMRGIARMFVLFYDRA